MYASLSLEPRHIDRSVWPVSSHGPLSATGGYISEMDDAVGTIYRAQQALGAARIANSIIIFSSDNGAPPAGSGPTGIDHTTDAEGRPCTGFMGCPNSALPDSPHSECAAVVRFPDPFACCCSQAVLSGLHVTIRTVSAASHLRSRCLANHSHHHRRLEESDLGRWSARRWVCALATAAEESSGH